MSEETKLMFSTVALMATVAILIVIFSERVFPILLILGFLWLIGHSASAMIGAFSAFRSSMRRNYRRIR